MRTSRKTKLTFDLTNTEKYLTIVTGWHNPSLNSLAFTLNRSYFPVLRRPVVFERETNSPLSCQLKGCPTRTDRNSFELLKTWQPSSSTLPPRYNLFAAIGFYFFNERIVVRREVRFLFQLNFSSKVE